jgi:hypothetical protein
MTASYLQRWNRKLAYEALDRINPTICELYAAECRPIGAAGTIAAGLGAAGVPWACNFPLPYLKLRQLILNHVIARLKSCDPG